MNLISQRLQIEFKTANHYWYVYVNDLIISESGVEGIFADGVEGRVHIQVILHQYLNSCSV